MQNKYKSSKSKESKSPINAKSVGIGFENLLFTNRFLPTKILIILCCISIVAFSSAQIFLFNSSLIDNINMSKTEKYLFGIGDFGDSPDSFVSDDKYYEPNIMTEYVNNTSDMKQLAYQMYRRACLTHYTTQQKSWHLFGEGKVDSIDSSGQIYASGYRHEKNRNDETYNSDIILQNVSKLSNISGGGNFILEMARDFVEYGEQRMYVDGTEYLRTADRDGFHIEPEYDLAAASFSKPANKYDTDELNKYLKSIGYVFREYPNDWYDEYGLDSPEKVDHIINLESIIDNSVKIVPKMLGDDLYYHLTFEIDCDKILSSGTTATYYFEQFMLRTLRLNDSGNPLIKNVDVKYNTLKIDMEIWDSGYLRSWNTSENWSVTAASTIGNLKITATTNIETKEYYSYNPEDNQYDELMSSFTAKGNYVDTPANMKNV